MKKLGIIGIAIMGIVIGCELLFASWLQNTINLSIPQGEYYNLIHLISIILHILILGGIYLAIAIYSAMGLIFLISE